MGRSQLRPREAARPGPARTHSISQNSIKYARPRDVCYRFFVLARVGIEPTTMGLRVEVQPS